MKNIFVILIAIIFFNLEVKSSTFYIDTGGSNSNTGAIGSPWLTLYYACTHTVSGDIIHVNAGTYTEVLQCPLPVGVSIEGAGVTSIIKSTLSADFTPLLLLQSAEGTNGNQHISNLKFDGQSLTTAWGIDVAGRSNVSIHDITMVDFRDRGVIFTGKSDFSDGPPSIYATGNTFYNNIVTNCAQYAGGYGRGCVNIGGQDGLLLHHNTLTQNSRPSGQNGWPLKLAGTGYIKGVKIYNNTLVKNQFQGNYPGDNDWDFAVELWYSQGGCEMYNNTITGGVDLAENYKTGSYTYSWYVHDNVISQPTLNPKFQGGIYTERQVEGIIIENNTFDKVATAVIMNIEDFGAGPYQLLKDIVIRKNLMTNIGKAIGDGNNGSGIWIYCDATATFDITRLYIEHNTIVAASGNAPFEGLNFNYGNALGTTKNVYVNDNIVQGFNDYWMRLGNVASTVDSFYVQNNDTYLNAGSNLPSYPYGTPTHYTNSGNLVGTNPLFVGGGNYTLQGGSPCIDAGTDGTDIGYTGGEDVLIITNLTPSDAATGIAITVHPVITFNNDLDGSTVNTSNITMSVGEIGILISVAEIAGVVTITPSSNLLPNTTYTITINTSVLDVNGVGLASPVTFSFTTALSTSTITTDYLIIKQRRG